MRPIRVTVGSQTVSAPIPLDTYQDPFNVTVSVALSAGASLTYTVQYTNDDVYSASFDPSTATWFNLSTLASKTVSADSNFISPVVAVRLSVGTYSSGTATMTLIQAGMPGR